MISVSDKYKIVADDNGVTVLEFTGRYAQKSGDPIYKTIGYYCTLHGALSGLHDYMVRNYIHENDCSLGDVVAYIEKLNAETEEILGKVVVH